jgi:hypothetical protein
MIWRGRRLENLETLDDLGLQEDDVVHVMVQHRGPENVAQASRAPIFPRGVERTSLTAYVACFLFLALFWFARFGYAFLFTLVADLMLGGLTFLYVHLLLGFLKSNNLLGGAPVR